LGLAHLQVASYSFFVKAKASKTLRKAPSANGLRLKSPAPQTDHTESKDLQEVLAVVNAESQTTRVEDDVSIDCPYCGESFEIRVSADEEGHTLDENCQVCCRPLTLHVRLADGEIEAEADRS
jgi:hypothetical protein